MSLNCKVVRSAKHALVASVLFNSDVDDRKYIKHLDVSMQSFSIIQFCLRQVALVCFTI